MTLALALVVGALFACGTYQILQRTLTRVIIGLAVMTHGANLLLLLAGGRAGNAPFVGEGGDARLAVETAGGAGIVDPLPQALVLTAIVISFGVGAFLLTLAYRSFLLDNNDEVEDDIEDRRIARLSSSDHPGGVTDADATTRARQ